MEAGGVEDKPSLRSRLKQHYQEQPIEKIFEPSPQRATKFGKAYVWINTFSLILSAPTVVPDVVPGSWQILAYLLIGVVFIEMGLNWGLCVMKDSNAYKATEADRKKRGDGATWKHCMPCQHDAPPRSHHCKICNLCILKRDHHCFFTGTCIGYFNQRYFLVWLFWVLVGQWYAVGLAYAYLEYRFESWSQWIVFITFYDWFQGLVSKTCLILTVQMYMCLTTGIFALFFFVWEIIITIYGMTSHEAYKGIIRYRKGTLWQNFRKVFGKWWLLNFIFPTQYAPEGDPVYWQGEKLN